MAASSRSPSRTRSRPANRDVARFVGHANLWDGRIAGPDRVETPLGQLVTAPHGRPTGESVAVLVRPERLRIGMAMGDVNSFGGAVTRDRFLGSFRRFDFQCGNTTLLGETSELGEISHVHIPPASVQILPETAGAANQPT